MKERLLGSLSAQVFLQRHWQKRPLFVRRAIPGFTGVTNRRALAALARRDDVESRIVERRGNRWETTHGPFDGISLGKANATLLVSGVNLHLRSADDLLRRFAFVPQARLDDVMVSYATPGGGVGPHVDSYDVFLLQGPGRRRWKVWFEEKILVYEVEAGDLLYLPPGLKHDGAALDACFTYSIGFRAPRGVELGAAFLDWLHERGLPDAGYRDPGLRPAAQPAQIPADLTAFAAKTLRRIRWSARDVGNFLGEYLSAPKQHIVFHPGKSKARLRGASVRLDPKTQLLYSGRAFFINGDRFEVPAHCAAALRRLADARHAEGASLARAPLADLIYEWRRLGYLHLEKSA